MSTTKVQVKPIITSKWHEKKGEESFTKGKVIRALVNVDTMTYATGLDYTNRVYDDPDGSKTKLTEAELYSKLLKADLSPQFDMDTPHPFWDSRMSSIKLENRTQLFDVKINPLDYVKWKIMKESKYVANSMKEYEEGMFPEATHVLFDESEEVEVKATKVAIKKQAYAETAKLSKGQKIELIMILSADGDYFKAKNLKGRSDDFVEVELDKLIETKPGDVVRHLKMTKEETATHALVLEALQKHALKKDGHKILYHDSVLGQDVQDVVKYLNRPDNQELKLRIIEQIN